MHLIDFNLNIDELTKVEGAAGLEIQVKKGKVESVKFKISDYKRFYTQAMRGKNVAAIPQLLARICGTCSNAHLLASIEAIEKAANFTPSAQTKLLRALTYHGLIIRDHALHLYLFVLPDLFNLDSLLAFDQTEPEQHQLLHDTFSVKAAGNHLAMLVAGRSVHAPLPIPGGFIKTPDNALIPQHIQELKAIRPAVLRLIEIFANCDFKLERPTDYIALKANSYSYLEGEIYNQDGPLTAEKDLRQYLEHVVLPYSQASAYTLKNKRPYRVGALARLNINKEALHPKTKSDAAKALQLFPSNNIFHNNLAQAIEILHSIDESIDILSSNTFSPETPAQLKLSAATGFGVIEAPRGTLYHRLTITNDGTVQEGEIIVPTSQNQIAIELDIAEFIQNNLHQPKDKLTLECEKIIRAYDPCMSCGAHFLEVKWLEE